MNSTQKRRIFTFALSLALLTAFLTFDMPQVLAAGGAFDITFDGNGRLATDFDGGSDVVNDILIQPDGKIVAVGSNDTATTDFCALARYNSNGSLDTTFGGDGRVTVVPTSLAYPCVLEAVAIQPDGKIIAAGRAFNAGAAFYEIAVFRLLANGNLDTSFSGDGIVYGVGFSGASEAKAIAIQPNGSIVVAGIGNSTSSVDMGVFRLTSAGVLDSTFSGDGLTTIDFGGATGEAAEGVYILSDGKILIGGTARPSNSNFALARLNSNGSLDTTLDLDGKVLTDIPGLEERVSDMKVQDDGKIILAGSTQFYPALVRYNANGTLDTTFDGDGLVTTFIDGGARVSEIDLQSDGKIVAAITLSENFGIIRYNPNGSLDPGFGDNGILSSDMTNGSSDTSNAVSIQPDGKIVVAGSTQNTTAGATRNFCVARYLPGGATPFDFDGDSKTDLSISRPNAPTGAEWWWLKSGTGGNGAVQFGTSTDRLAPVDFTGDGKTDVGFWRPSTGQWFVLRSEDFSFYAFPFGATGDFPVPADYDGDGKADAAVFRESAATWYISRSSGGTDIVGFGAAGDKPVNADYDGDGKADIAIYRPNGPGGAEWWVRRSSNASVFALQFGSSTDKAVPGDFTGDGKADVAFWRPATGFWNVLRSEDFSYYAFPFGANGDIASPGDYDGDGKLDAAVFRPSSATWFANRSTAGTLIQQFGAAGDVPVPSAFVR